MADFPTTVKNFLALQDGVDSIIAAHPNDRGDEITAIETLIGPLGSTQAHSASLKNLLLDYRKGCAVVPDTVAQITVQAGEIALTNGSGDAKWRRNTGNTTVTWTDIDTGAEAGTKRYYVHAVADSAATTFTVVISLSPTAPTGITYFHLLGSFFNNSSSDIEDVMDDDLLFTKTPGEVTAYTLITAPVGAILCEGSATVGTTVDPTLSDLFDVIGTTFGGSDATDFQVPDLRGRTIIGLDNMGGSSANVVTAAAADSIGGTSGVESFDNSHDHGGATGSTTLTESQMPAHTHDNQTRGVSTNGNVIGNTNLAADTTIATDSTGGGTGHTHTISSVGSATQTLMSPYMALAYVIWK